MRTCYMTEYKCPMCGEGMNTDGFNAWCQNRKCENKRLYTESELARPETKEAKRDDSV